ncbi:MAG: hypothetical protein M1814_000553 [Vezdaea aestivalis]|nr:MAG: hypothetical protein M1814_000553 [Vezdaea aestivalis]
MALKNAQLPILCDFLAPRLLQSVSRPSHGLKRTLPQFRRIVAPLNLCHQRHNSTTVGGWRSRFAGFGRSPKRTSDLPKGNENTSSDEFISSLFKEGQVILSSHSTVPSHLEISNFLNKCTICVEGLKSRPADTVQKTQGPDNSSIDTILDIAGRGGQQSSTESQASKVAGLSELAMNILRHKPVFISIQVLASFVDLQVALDQPFTLPEAFDIYASKAAPLEGSSPIKYSTQNANHPRNAIPAQLASKALDSAIKLRQLPTAISIIRLSFGTKASQRNRLIRIAGLPIAAVLLSPLGIYMVASKLAAWSAAGTWYLTTGQAFAGFMAYITFTGTLGFVAITTANDQMNRVTWAIGMPLSERWLREEERAAYDEVAGAWGFKKSSRRGDEEGQDWENLREYLGINGMVLDRPSLMEGME